MTAATAVQIEESEIDAAPGRALTPQRLYDIERWAFELESGVPRVQNGTVSVLDFSAAKDGPLVAYRWDEEPELGNHKLVAVGGGV